MESAGMVQQNPLDMMIDARVPYGLGGRWYGVFPAQVTDLNDPDGQGRVKVKIPGVPDTGDGQYEVWARLATLMTGKAFGSWFIPDREIEVLVIFEGGDPRRPYVIGSLWNGQDVPPQKMDGESLNNVKVLHSRSGIKITLDDTEGSETLKLETPAGQQITLKDGPGSIELLDSNGNSIRMDTGGITINAASEVKINASTVDVTASMVTVNAAMSQFSGVVQADTIITNAVVSSSYTPGAGNIW
jgi:uncharacterized protein involved in type VI secretion and phage assembly